MRYFNNGTYRRRLKMFFVCVRFFSVGKNVPIAEKSVCVKIDFQAIATRKNRWSVRCESIYAFQRGMVFFYTKVWAIGFFFLVFISTADGETWHFSKRFCGIDVFKMELFFKWNENVTINNANLCAFSKHCGLETMDKIKNVEIVQRREKSQQYSQATVWLGKFIKDCNQMAGNGVVVVTAQCKLRTVINGMTEQRTDCERSFTRTQTLSLLAVGWHSSILSCARRHSNGPKIKLKCTNTSKARRMQKRRYES